MERVSNLLQTQNLIYNLGNQKSEIEKYNRQIVDQNKIQMPHDNPVDTIKIMKYRNRIEENKRYLDNIEDGISVMKTTDDLLDRVNESLKQLKEIAVMGANGTYTKTQMEYMSAEVEQHLSELVSVANTKIAGKSLFSGHQSNVEPFQIVRNKIPRFGEPVITEVKYIGDIGKRYREIDRGEYMEVNLPGNMVFWSNNNRIESQTDSSGYVSDRDQYIKIDGVEMLVEQGDNLETIVKKINDMGLSVKAEIDNTTGNNFLALQTTKPHQMWLEDAKGGTVLQDLGLIAVGASSGPNNYAPSAIVHGNSMFDTVMDLRNSLASGDYNGVNKALGDIDNSIDNLLAFRTNIGARHKRLEHSNEKINNTIMVAQEIRSKLQDTDVAKAIMDMKNVEVSNNLSLQLGARLIPRTLLDFLR